MAYGSKSKMYPNVALALAALALLFLAGRAAGETAKERVERFELFGDCKPMALVVENLPPDASKIGLTVDSLQAAAVESRLRAARLYDSEVLSPRLYVNVNVVGGAFSIRFQYDKLFYDPLSGFTNIAATWDIGSTGTHGGDAGYILSWVSQYMDQFLLEFLELNYGEGTFELEAVLPVYWANATRPEIPLRSFTSISISDPFLHGVLIFRRTDQPAHPPRIGALEAEPYLLF